MSVQRLAKTKEYNILFDDVYAYLYQKVDGWRIGLGKVQHGLYYLPWGSSNTMIGVGSPVAMRKATPKETILEIHQRMGHP